MADIGAKIKLEGEAEFRKNITNITNQSKALASEMKAVESSFNSETTAQEKATKKAEVLTKQIDVQKQKVALLTDMYQKSAAELGENDNKTLGYKDDLNKAQAALNKMNNELDATEKSVDEYGNEITEAEKGNEQFTQSVGALLGNEKLKEFFASAAEKISEFAGKAVDAAKELDVGYDAIIKKTGATGEAFDEMKGIANDIYGSMPVEMEDVGNAIGEVNTRLGLQGKALQSASEQVLKFANINGVDAVTAIDDVQNMLSAYGMSVDDVDEALDVMNRTGQKTGVHMDNLASSVVENATAFQEMGMDMYQSIDFMGQLATSGADANTVLSGMKRGLKKATDQGIPFNEALAQMQDEILNGTDSMDGLQVAYELFGKSGAGVYQAVKTGSIDFKNLAKSQDILADSAESVADTYEATLSPWDKTKTAMNNLKTVASDLAGNALSQLVPAIEKITDVVKKVSDWFDKLSPSGKKVVGVLTAIGAGAAILGPKIMTVVTTLKELKTASDLAKSIKNLGGEMQQTGGSAGGFASQIGQVGAIIGITVGALIAYTEATKALRIATDEQYASLVNLSEEGKTLTTELEASQGPLDDLKEAYYGNSEQIDTLTGRLVELNDKQSLTSEESEEYQVIVAKLEKLLPGFSSEIDNATGKLKDQTQISKKNIDALKELAKVEAAEAGLSQAIQKSTEAAIKQKQAVENVRTAIRNMGGDVSNLSDVDLMALASNVKETGGLMGFFADAAGGASQLTKELGNAIATNAEAYNLANEQIAESDSLIAEYNTQLDGAVTTTDELGTEAVTTAEEIAASQEEIQKAYEETAAAARKTLEEQGGLFKKFEYDTNVSLDSIEEALESQTQAYATWSENATAVMEDARYGTDVNFTAMANTILNMGMEGASYLKTFVDAAQSEDGRLEGVLNDFGAASVAQQAQANVFASWEQQFADFANGTTGTLLNATPGLTEAGYNFGAAAPEGTAQGMEDNAGVVETASSTLGGKVTTALENSKAVSQAKETGKAIVIGVATSIATSLPKLATAVANLMKPVNKIATTIRTAQPAINTAGRGIASGLASGMTGGTGLVSSAATTLVNAAKISVSSSDYNGQGKSIASGFANGITDNKGLVKTAAGTAANAAKITVNKNDYTYVGTAIAAGFAKGITDSKFVVESAAKGAVSSAIKAAKQRAGIQSPSKEFAYLGEMSAAGYAVGLKDSAGMISRATQKMMSIPDASSVAGNRGGVSNSYSSSYGDIVVNVSGANVSDPNRLADMVADRINRQVLSRRAAFA